jgi:hypothetical protein
LPDVVPSAPAGDLTAEERAKLDTYRELEKAGQLSDTGRARMQALEARLRPGGKAPVQPVAQPAPASVSQTIQEAAQKNPDRPTKVAASAYAQEWVLPKGVTYQMLDRASLILSPAQLDQVFAELVRLNPSLSGVALPSPDADYSGWGWAEPSRKIAGADARVRAILDVVRGVASKFQLDNIKFFVEDLKGSAQTRPGILDTPAQKAAADAALETGTAAPVVRSPAQPVSPAQEFEAALGLMKANGDLQAVETFQKLQEDWRLIAGRPSIDALANLATLYAAGGLDTSISNIALLMGLDSVPKLRVLAVDSPDLSAWGDTSPKTGGLLVKGEQIYLDPFAYYKSLVLPDQTLLFKTVAHELWHVILDRVTMRMSGGDRAKQKELYQKLYDAVPPEFKAVAARTAWGYSQDVVVDEFLRAVLEKNASPLLKNFADLIDDPKILEALAKAQTTEEISLVRSPQLLEALTKSVVDFDLTDSKVLGKLKPGIFAGIKQAFVDLLNAIKGTRREAGDPLVQVIDAALKAAKVEAPRNRLKAAKVREAKAAAPVTRVKVPRKVEKATSEFEQLPNWAGASPEARQAYQYLATRSGKGGRPSTDPGRAAESQEAAMLLKQTAYVGVMRDFDARATQKLKDAYTNFIRQLTSSQDADELDRLTPAARQDFDSALARELFRRQDYQADKLSDEFIKAAQIALNAKLRGSQASMVPVGESIERAVGEDLAPSAGDDLGTSALAAGPSPGAPLTEVNLQIKNAYELMALVSGLSKASAEEKAKGADLIELIRQKPDFELTSDKIRAVLGREFPVEMSSEAQILYRLGLQLLPLQLQAEALEARLKAPRSKKDKAELTKDLGLVTNQLTALVEALRRTVPNPVHLQTLLTYIMNVREGGRPAPPPAQATQAVRYSLPVAQGDEEYLRLAQDPVGNREALQRMVDEAARKAGYNVDLLYHGANPDRPAIEVIDPLAKPEANRKREAGPKAFWTTPSEGYASNYGGRIYKVYAKKGRIAGSGAYLTEAGTVSVPGENPKLSREQFIDYVSRFGRYPLSRAAFPQTGGSYVFGSLSKISPGDVYDNWGRLGGPKMLDLLAYTDAGIISMSHIGNSSDRAILRDIFLENGFDTYFVSGNGRGEFALLRGGDQIKSADPVTYDDNGNVIPLSQRFQPTEPDIRYSLPVALPNDLFSTPPSENDAWAALDEAKSPLWGAHRGLKAGTPVGVRIDIPAYLRRGVFVQTVHKPATPGNVGDRIGYDNLIRLSGPVRFFVKEGSPEIKSGALAIKEGRAKKHPIATVEGNYSRDRSIPRDINSWTPVGMNPVKHSYFYDKRTGEPVVGGSESYSVGNTVFVKDPVYGVKSDFRYSLPVAQGDEDLGAAETRLRGAFTRILDQVLLPARERDEDLYTNTLYQAARKRLQLLETQVNNFLTAEEGEPVTLASDEFEDVVQDPRFRSYISSLPIFGQPDRVREGSAAVLREQAAQIDRLMQDRANVLEERAARQLASDMVRLEDAQALLEFWQTVDQTAPGVAAIVKRLQNKAEKLANAVKDPPADRLERAMQIKRSEDTKIDRAAAARAQSGPLLEWLRSAGSAELVSEILSQEPFRAEVVLAERGPRTTAVVGANAPGMSGPLGSETPQITPAYSLAGLLGRALDAFTASGAGGLGLRRLLDGFDRQRRAANAALASKEAQALAREIVQISQEIKQAHANLGQGRLDLRAVLRTFDGRTNESASMRFTRKELQELANLDEAAEQSALQLVSLIQDNRNPALAGAVLDLLARPSKGAASPAESAERVPSTAELAKLLAKELGLSENTLNVLLGAMAKSNPVREAFSALVDRKLGVPLIYELNYLESATKAFNEAAEKFRATPVAEDAKKEFQAALDARDAAINRVLVPLRNRLQSQGANVRGLESRLLAKLIQQRTLQMTAEAFETIASDPEFNRARFNIESATAQDYSLYRLIKPTNDGFSFAAFGLRDPKTGELIPKTGAESFAWTPKDLESGKVEQLRNYFDQAAKLLDLYHAAEMAYRTDPDTVPSPAQLGYDARTMQALALMLERDAPDFYSPELRSPELARGAVGFMDATPLTRKLWRAWVSMPGFFGGLSKVGLEVFSYQLPGQAGALLRDKLGKVTTLQSNLRGLFAQAMSPGKRGAQGLEQKLRKAMESHGVDQYGVPVLTAEQYRLKVMNPLGSLGRTASTQRHPLKVGDEIPGSDQKVTQADLDFMQAESDFTKSVYTLLVRTGRADRFIVEGGFSRNPLANWIYNINRSVSDRLQEFVNRVAELERSSPGASLTKGDAAAMDFWARPENFQLVLAHVRDALLDPAEDAVAHRPGVREAMAEAARSVDSATNLTEVVQLLGATRAAARAGLSPAALQSALNDELDQLLNNAREMVSVELDDTISEGYFKRQGISTDNQFTSPFGPRKLPSSLYNYGNLTQRDHDRFLRNAEKLEMVDLLNALEFANQQLDALLKGYERGDAAVKREFESRFTDPDEARVLLTQGKQLHKDLMTKASGAANLATNWLSKVYTGLALGKPPVWLFNGATAPYMFSEQMRTIDVGGFAKPRRESVKMAARLAKLTGRSALAYTVGKLSEQVAKVAAKNGIKSSSLNWMLSKGLELADRERIMRDELRGLGGSDRLDFWVEYDRAKDVLQVDGIVSDDLPETYRSWDNWLSRRGLDPVRAFGTAALKKVNTSVADMRINSAIMLGMDSLSESFAVVADRYLTRLENAGKLDRNNFKGALQELLKPGADFQGLAVTAADFGGTNGRKSDEARLQRLRQWLTLAGFPSPEQMFLDYYARRTTNPQTSFFNSDQMRALLQKVVADTNSPTLANRPLAFQVDGNTAELFKLMGYGTNAIFQAAVAPVRVRRTMAEGGHVVDLQQFFWLTGSIPMLMLYGSAAVGLRELWRRYMQNRGRSVDTIFDPDVYNDPRRVGRMILRNAVAAVPFPVLGDVLNWMVQADPFGRGIDPVDRLVVSSLVRLIMSETANTWTSLQPVASGEFGEAATRLLRQGLRLGNQLLPFAAETSGALARSGVAMEGPVRMMQQSSAERLAASQAPGILKPGVAVASAKAAMTPNPFRDPMRMMLEAQVEKNPAKYEEGMRYFVRALQEKNAERIKRGQDPITLEEQLRASSEGYVPFKYTAPGATQTEIASAMAAVPESSRQAIMERQAMVSNVRGGEEVRLGVQPRGQSASGGGGGGGGLPTSSLRLPGIGRVSVGGGGGGGGSRLSRSRRRRPRLTLGGRGRNLSRLRVRRLRSPRNRLLRRRRA